jgi:hypothetical protein
MWLFKIIFQEDYTIPCSLPALSFLRGIGGVSCICAAGVFINTTSVEGRAVYQLPSKLQYTNPLFAGNKPCRHICTCSGCWYMVFIMQVKVKDSKQPSCPSWRTG